MSRAESLLLVFVLTLAGAACSGGGGDSGPGANQADMTPPSTPAGLVANAAGGSVVNLTWNASTDNVAVTGYVVKRNGVQIGTPTTTAYSDTGLSPATAYSYTVAARDAAGNISPDSASVSATTDDTIAPTTPTGLVATAAGGSAVNLIWNASTDNVAVTGYVVKRNGVTVGTPTTPGYSDTGLSPATTYGYTVAARDAAGNFSSESTIASATTADTIAPTTPAGLVATAAGATVVNLTWNASTDNVAVTGYVVKRNGVPVGTPTTPGYSDTGLSPATTYGYTVAARDAAGNFSPDSVSAGATTAADTIAPSTPAGLVASPAGKSAINLTWSASTDNVGVTGYIVKRNGTQVATPTATSYADTLLSSATTYSYTVAARDAAGNISPDSASVSATTADTLFPLHTEAGKRYLVDAAGNPFLMLGESPQAMIGEPSVADAELFLANRKSHGFNTVWINLLCASYTGCNPDGTTVFGSLAPFTVGNDLSTYDLSTPNEAYFGRVDSILQLAARYGFLVVLDPAETGSWLSVLQRSGLAKSFSYGQYLGTRYKDFPNIVWMSGNDFQTWRASPGDVALVQAVAQGIKDRDPNHIHTVELDYYVSSSLDDSSWAPIVSLNAAYTYRPTYAEVLHAYNQSASVPVFMVEANYEFENNTGAEVGTPAILRRQEYWTALSGATGQLYGNHYTWGFGLDWKNQLDTPGAAQIAYVKALFEPRAWYELVPDQGHTVVTVGYGTFSDSGTLGASDYVTAARTPSGKLVMAYVPSARTITVDMSQLSGPATARWYDPTAGTFADIAGSPLANAGSHDFPTPGTPHTDGATDWVLVLEAN